jgi:uncharacterized protein (DUF1684 family)
MINNISQSAFLTILLLTIIGCGKKTMTEHQWSTADSMRIINETLAHRAEADSFFRFDPNSPFKRDSAVHYEGIKWYPPDVRYCFQSKLFRYDKADTVIILGTKGEERKYLKYGYFTFIFNGSEHKLNCYKFTASDPKRYELYRNHLSVSFTDETTGKETYPVGRYVEVEEENPDKNFIYTINFNNAYNPYCAYTSMYTCAVPRKEDHLDFAVEAGEMKYHL